ncbi:hypothetical protein DHEL01_v208388 [Diaporthe helianthi]|uniref:Uncharacterized protein n=1 Tax=Diaporthe helianthi TaxID=158607 RepID=A0A2P5HSI7_DIAHE|nr:hypothetical protein DHEL01_v208388 [Diaporthe helianthi]
MLATAAPGHLRWSEHDPPFGRKVAMLIDGFFTRPSYLPIFLGNTAPDEKVGMECLTRLGVIDKDKDEAEWLRGKCQALGIHVLAIRK